MSRTQEFKADMESVKLVGKPKSLATALCRLMSFKVNYIIDLEEKDRIFPTIFTYNSKPVIERINVLLRYTKMYNLDF